MSAFECLRGCSRLSKRVLQSLSVCLLTSPTLHTSYSGACAFTALLACLLFSLSLTTFGCVVDLLIPREWPCLLLACCDVSLRIPTNRLNCSLELPTDFARSLSPLILPCPRKALLFCPWVTYLSQLDLIVANLLR